MWGMRRSPWLPVLILVAVGLYMAPREGGSPVEFQFDWSPLPRVEAPQHMPSGARDLFVKSRPATVRVEQSGERNGTPDAIGTGFFIDDSGTLLTAYHVVENARHLNVLTVSRMRFRAHLVGFDARRDVAVLKADVRGKVPFLALADRTPRVGERVLAIGNSRNQFLQPREGRLLRLNAEAARADFPQGTLEMSAPLAPGDSGGPILNTAGHAVGVVSYIRLASDDFGSAGDEGDVRTLASYAVPVTLTDATVRAMREGKKNDVPALGIEGGSAHQYETQGAVVVGVVQGSPAARAGLLGERSVPVRRADGTVGRRLVADIIVAVDGQPTDGFDELLFQIRQKRIGQTVQLTVDRDGKMLTISVKLGPKATIFSGRKP